MAGKKLRGRNREVVRQGTACEGSGVWLERLRAVGCAAVTTAGDGVVSGRRSVGRELQRAAKAA